MPIGSFSLVPHIALDLIRHKPMRVLDLGIGFGFYGAVVRQWLDQGVKPWSTRLVGVEAWGNYANPMWDLYDMVVVDTIENFLSRHSESFEYILMTDVIEHFERPAAINVMRSIVGRLTPRGRFIVGTPGVFFAQGAVHGNDRETHRSHWTIDDFIALGFSPLARGEQVDPFGQKMVLAAFQKNV